MPIVLRHNAELELSRVEYFGVIRAQDLHDHAAYNAANPVWLGFDCISVIHDDVDPTSMSKADLDSVFVAHRQLFEPLGLLFMRRSGWVCMSPIGEQFLGHWMNKRNADKSPWADVRQFNTFEAASEWLLLNADGAHALKFGEDFKEIVRFAGASAPSR